MSADLFIGVETFISGFTLDQGFNDLDLVMDSTAHNITWGPSPDFNLYFSTELLSDSVQDLSRSLLSLHWTSYVYVLLGLLTTKLLYYVLFSPINWTKDLSEVGYGFIADCPQYQVGHKTKRDRVREVRKRRQVGDLPPVYPNGWFALLESPDIKPGQVKHVEALGENFAVFRNKEGRVFVLDAYCPHLGANMAIGGVVKGDCLECPFHAWQFSGEDGKCSHIPYTEKVPKFAKVKKWTSCEVNDYVFVWYHAEGSEPTWQVEPTEQIHSRSWWYRGRSEFFINSHIEDIPENAADAAHLNAIHRPALVGGSDLRFYEGAWHSFAQHTWKASWSQHTAPGEEHIGTMKLDHDIRLFNRYKIIVMNVTARQMGPGYVHMHVDTSIGPMIIVQTVTPVEPLLQRVIHRMYCPPLLMPYAGFTLIGEAIQFERDIMVWNHKKYVKPLLVKEDQAIVRHRRWFSQFYSENSPKFSFQRDGLNW